MIPAMRICACLLAALLIASGCAPRSTGDLGGIGASGSSEQERPETGGTAIRVITDPAEISALTPEAVTDPDPVDLLLGRLGDDFFFAGEDDVEHLAEDRPRAVARLEGVLEAADASSANEATMRSAELLVRLGEPSGYAFFERVLERAGEHGSEKNGEVVATVYRAFGEGEGEQLSSRPKSIEHLLAGLRSDDASVQSAAVQLAGIANVPQAMPLLQRILSDPTAEKRSRAAFWLARRAPSLASLEATVAYLLEPGREEDVYWLRTALETYLESSDEAIVERARSFLARYADSEGSPADDAGERGRWIGLLAEHATSHELEALTTAWQSDIPAPSKGIVLDALVRLEGEAVKPRLARIADGDDRALKSYLAPAIGALHAGSEDTAAVDQLRQLVADGATAPSDAVEAMQRIGGEAAEKAALELWPRLDPTARAASAWKIKGISADDLADRLKEVGQVAAIDVAAVRQRVEDEWQEPANEIWVAQEVLADAGALAWFDVEVGEFPVPHDSLIEDFARISFGAFSPAWTDQIWLQENDEDYEADYLVRFGFSDLVFEFTAENHGDWYDVGAVVDAVNTAMQTTGRPERLQALYTGDQTASYIFSTAGLKRVLEEEFFLGFEDADGDAMQRGKEFEAQAIQKLLEGGAEIVGESP